MKYLRVDIGGTPAPEGTEFAFSLYALHRDPRFFPDPSRFDPGRWLPSPRAAIPKGAFIPFGTGNRRCLGDSLAWSELLVTVATVLSRRRLVPEPDQKVREVVAVATYPDPLQMRPIARTGPSPLTDNVMRE
ncbi:cytochrome P450 [Streptomyces sp. NPDC102259]|uniref:cytochrome P450 n=1 Tax=Streptomyces sp. NPDC102259 TaxID=3366148 RepID=UPI003805BCDE